MRVTERMIAKADLTKSEAKLIRAVHGLPSAGRRTLRWVAGLGVRKYDSLLKSAEEKLERTEG
jgi:hypothetical protein